MNDEVLIEDEVTVDLEQVIQDIEQGEVYDVRPSEEAVSSDNLSVYIVTPSTDNKSDLEKEQDIDYILSSPGEMVLQSVSVSNEKITPSDTNGFKASLLSIIGDYETVITDYEYRNNNNTYSSHSIDVQPDFVWLGSALYILIGIILIFQFIGRLINKI